MSSGPSLHLISPSSLLTSDLLLTKARKPRSRLADELREPWDSLRKAEFGAPAPSSRGEGAVSRTALPPPPPTHSLHNLVDPAGALPRGSNAAWDHGSVATEGASQTSALI